MNNTQEKKCIDLVADKFAEQEQTYKDVQKFFEDYENATEGEQIALKVIDENKGNYYHEYEDLFDYVNQTVLSWDYVKGYYRLQLSWGGPSDEFRIYTGANKSIEKIKYWYLDWFDGACIDVPRDSVSWDICSWYIDLT
jgi:hypothetical protein